METEQSHNPDELKEGFICEEIKRMKEAARDKKDWPSDEDMKKEVEYKIKMYKEKIPPDERVKLIEDNLKQIDDYKCELESKNNDDYERPAAERSIRTCEHRNRILNAIQEGKF